jgi:hypothetical protein
MGYLSNVCCDCCGRINLGIVNSGGRICVDCIPTPKLRDGIVVGDR